MTNIIKDSLKTAEFFWRSLAKDILSRDEILAWTLDIDNEYLNSVITTDLENRNIENIITEVTKFFSMHNVPWTWLVNPLSTPADLGKQLIDHGFSLLSTYNMFAYDLTDKLPVELLKNYNIKEAETKKDLEDWIIPLHEGFKSTEENSSKYLELNAVIPYSKNNAFHHYVVYQDNIPVAASTLSLSTAGARIDNVATRTNYQRQGFAKVATLYAMSEAKRLGYKICYLDSSDIGNFLYKSLGFKVICQANAYKKKIY